MNRLCKLISDYMGVLVLLAAVLALLFPGFFCHIKPSLINPLLGVIMFGMGLTLSRGTSQVSDRPATKPSSVRGPKGTVTSWPGTTTTSSGTA